MLLLYAHAEFYPKSNFHNLASDDVGRWPAAEEQKLT
jgi:hypothetical protein